MLDELRQFVETTDPIFQWLAVMAAGAIPFVESYFAGPLGIIAGINPVIAIIAAIGGNIVSMIAVVLLSDKIRSLTKRQDKPLSPRKQKFKEKFDKYGVAGVSLLGQTLLPSQITSGAMVAFGAKKNAVILWQIISIILWGLAFSMLALGGMSLVG